MIKIDHMIRLYRALICCFLLCALWGCGTDMEKETFGVYLIPKEGIAELLGEVVGLSECKKKVENIASYKNLVEYDYYCCLKTAESECVSRLK